MPDPRVSIVILNYYHPEIINICLRSLELTEGIEYEEHPPLGLGHHLGSRS